MKLVGQLCSFKHALAFFLQFSDVEAVAIWEMYHTSPLVDSIVYETLVLRQ